MGGEGEGGAVTFELRTRQPPDLNLSPPPPHSNSTPAFQVWTLLIVASLVSGAVGPALLTRLLGTLCMVAGLVNFAAPLVKVREILTRGSIGMEISPSMAVAQLACSVLWLGVGINKSDPVIAVPNGIGLCLSMFTGALFAILPWNAEGATSSSMATIASMTAARRPKGAPIAFMPVVNPAGEVDDDENGDDDDDIDLRDLDELLEGEDFDLGGGDVSEVGRNDDDQDAGFDERDLDFLASFEDEEEEEGLIG